MLTISLISLALVALPAWLFTKNVRRYRAAPVPRNGIGVSILIPARNEAAGIAAAVNAARAGQHVDAEVIVLDDHSTDATAEIVRAIAATDPHVRLESAPPLPPGWAGKQHACAVLARLATHPYLLFQDADVRLAPDAAGRLAAFQQATGASLVSGIPRQLTRSLAERLVIPLIHFLMLGFLPVGRMRRSRHPAYGAGCGQLFFAVRADYESMGGHEAIRGSFHDGLQLPRAFRRAGLATDICDATDLAECRMYHSACELWNGLAKNAGEGLGSLASILPWTILLLGGQVAPFVLVGWPSLEWTARLAALVAVACAWWPRLLGSVRFQQSWLGVVLHPIGVTMLVAIQWYALARRLIGRPVGWKGRIA